MAGLSASLASYSAVFLVGAVVISIISFVIYCRYFYILDAEDKR